jgi:uncharacterized tellurite resistance protein B-like protein
VERLLIAAPTEKKGFAVSVEEERRIAEEFKTAMIEAIEKFFETHLRPSTHSPSAEVPERRLQLAAAVILIEMTRADLDIKEEEHRAVTKAIQQALKLSTEETTEIVALAEKQVERSVPLYLFVRLIDREFSFEQKKSLIEQMWRVAFSDAQIMAHEEYLIRKVSELLHVPLADFLDAKIRARDAFK